MVADWLLVCLVCVSVIVLWFDVKNLEQRKKIENMWGDEFGDYNLNIYLDREDENDSQ